MYGVVIYCACKTVVCVHKHWRHGKDTCIWPRSLSPAEKNYSQIEKEGLAVEWGVKQFHQYLYGRQFVVYSDHKPLQFLFSETKPVPMMASSRIQRWALTLSVYKYQMVFRAGKNLGNANGLSRLLLAEALEEVFTPGDIILMLQAFSDTNSYIYLTLNRQTQCTWWSREWCFMDGGHSERTIQALRVQEVN